MDSFKIPEKMYDSALPESSCGYLLRELKLIWDEVGHSQLKREKVLLELERECLDVFRRKVNSANTHRAHLHQELADSEAELTYLLISLGERSLPSRPEKMTGTLKKRLDSITPSLRDMRLRKEGRLNQFQEVQTQIWRISTEIAGQTESTEFKVNDTDLSLKKLEEYQNELQWLHKVKFDRLLKVEEYTSSIHDLATIMGMDSTKIIANVHPGLGFDYSSGPQPKNISDTILDKLNSTMEFLKEEKQNRLEKLHGLAKALLNLWSIMDTPFEDRRLFAHVTDFISTKAGASSPGSLTHDMIQQTESEVKRLDQLKKSKMRDLFLKKQTELEEIGRKSHMEIPKSEVNNIMNLINSGEIDHANLLISMDGQILKANEEASRRNDIIKEIEKWMASCNEGRWLEEYNRDEKRYSVSRGAHKKLKRAERARMTVNRIPGKILRSSSPDRRRRK